ncbi:hypothetical protein OG21DRAFT_1513919 [Imleria badia]|nr:hypothetical protein OG21DRAFT_1513919 [Imleria badia]
MSESASVRHPLYYFPNGSHIFRVEKTLYKLHDDHLAHHSGLFNDMFAIGDAGSDSSKPALLVEGKSDANPIVLEGEQQAVFDLFMDHIHGRSRNVGSGDPYSPEELQDMLQFADKYRCPMTRFFAIAHMWETRWRYHPAKLVQLGCQFNIPKLFKRGFQSLLNTPLKEISKQHRLEMGNDVFVALVYAKSVLEEHSRIIACQEPVILTHADDCQDPLACQADWHSVWWNGMGRFLLDAKNPQPFDDAVKRFRKMEFGRMGTGCQQLMFQILERGVGFRYAEVFITSVCSGLVDDFHLSDPL